MAVVGVGGKGNPKKSFWKRSKRGWLNCPPPWPDTHLDGLHRGR